jgi:RimJ/RimL family protein N-acetyltransferase
VVAWDGTVVLRTERLALRTFTRADLPLYHALNADPEVYRWLGGSPLTREWSDEIAEWANHCYETERLGLLAVERTSDGTFLGMCGLHHQESAPDEVEVAWRLDSRHWGQGYATEAARAWVRYGFTTLELPRIISMTDHDNVRSRAVMERLGMTYSHDARIVDDGQEFDAVVYAIDAGSWRARAAEDAAPG